MEPILMYGQPVADKILDEVKEHLNNCSEPSKLAIVSVGNDAASEVYMRNKIKTAKKCGIVAEGFHFGADVDYSEVVNTIFYLNRTHDGVIVQLPLPKHFPTETIIDSINYSRDVDCLSEAMTGAFYKGRSWCNPCTPQAVMDILAYYNIELKGKNVVVIGRSQLVGRPVAELMLREDATVTICHSKTSRYELLHAFAHADVVVSAAGVANLITEEDAYQYWKDNRHDTYGDFAFKRDRVIVDVSINRDVAGKLCGDFAEEFKQKYSSHYTPVPKGVGPVTVAELMRNVVSY